MRTLNSERPAAGTLLLSIARLIFDDEALAAVVRPTIADLQHEVRRAGASRRHRLLARCRGYGAFWALVAIASFALIRRRSHGNPFTAFPARADRIAIPLIVMSAMAFAWQSAGLWSLVPFAGGTIMAIVIRRWRDRHQSEIDSSELWRRRPEINFSAIPVGGDFGGLIFVIGSLAIIIVGLPGLRWFLAGAAGGGIALALILARTHSKPGQDAAQTRSLALR